MTLEEIRDFLRERGYEVTVRGDVCEAAAAALLSKAPKTLGERRRTGLAVPDHTRIGRTCYYPLTAIQAWLNEHTVRSRV